jgi:hypothetical protein
MTPAEWEAVRAQTRQVSAFLKDAAVIVGTWYAKGRYGARPIVDRHFTPGNAMRYRWAPLAASTLASRTKHAKHKTIAKAKGFQASRSDKSVGARMTPVLVETGALRDAVATTGRVTASGTNTARCTWTVPDYGKWHLPGYAQPGRPPVRDYITPNDQDVRDLEAICQQELTARIGGGKRTRATFLKPGAPPAGTS